MLMNIANFHRQRLWSSWLECPDEDYYGDWILPPIHASWPQPTCCSPWPAIKLYFSDWWLCRQSMVFALYSFPVYFFLHWYHVSQVCDTSVWKEVAAVKKITGDDEMDPSESTFVDPGSNVYSFGLLMLEIISGKLPNFEEQGSLLSLVRLSHRFSNSCVILF